tara:strand:+ start:4322 stop:4708 length:387 start_codon:yes stop_codon:yes gene_type:complete
MENQSDKPKLMSLKAVERYVGSRDLVVNAYAPWCHHCKEFESVYGEFRAKLRETNPHVSVVRLNAHKHFDELQRTRIGEDMYKAPLADAIEYFPTILLLRKDGRGGIYDGERAVPAMVEAISKFFSAS